LTNSRSHAYTSVHEKRLGGEGMTLDPRKGRILQAIVTDYVQTAEPIGSEWLVTHYDFGCKSATLRNEMAEMSDLGYLVQPHTSAGRIPSTRGYRYYVDCLIPSDSADDGAGGARIDPAGMEVEEMVQVTCRALSDMTHYPSVATTPIKESNYLHRLYVAPASARHILLVALFTSGHVEHQLLEVSAAPSQAALERITNYLNRLICGKDLDQILSLVQPHVPPELHEDRVILRQAYQAVVGTVRRLAENKVFLEGTAHILRQREFQDVLRLEQLLSALEQHSVLFQVFSRALLGEDVTVIIGDEASVKAMSECSIVTSPYRVGGRTGGFIGVVGPTRMRYDEAINAVGYMSRSLTSLLSRASLE
jgi:heat-inducible transcriptional repressor